MNHEQIEHMVLQFLNWRLPDTFNPDGGISFIAPHRPEWWPVGTNVLNYEEAMAMVLHMLKGLPPSEDTGDGERDMTDTDEIIERAERDAAYYRDIATTLRAQNTEIARMRELLGQFVLHRNRTEGVDRLYGEAINILERRTPRSE